MLFKLIIKPGLTMGRAVGKCIFLALSILALTACIDGNDDSRVSRCCGESELLSAKFDNLNDLVFFGSFEKTEPGEPEWIRDWGIPYTVRAEHIELSSNAAHGKRAIRIHFPKGSYGTSSTGAQFPIQFSLIEGMQQTFNSLYLSYYIYFENGFDFRIGGKLPGLMGGGASWERSGGSLPSGSNGWSLRFMWREKGRAVVYAYLPPGKYRKNSNWGTDIDLGKRLGTGKWHHIEQYVNVNSINKEDGQLRVWVDGQLLLDLNDVTYRTVENGNGEIGGILVSTFHGGNDPRWAPTKNSYMHMDSISASRKRISQSLLNPPKE